MKKIMIAVAILFAFTANAQKKDTIYAAASLNKATVYYGYGADLQHSSKVNLINGMQELIIDNVSLYPDINTLQISCPENVTILSYQHRIFTKPTLPKPPTAPSKMYDTIKLLQKQIGGINNEININDDQIRRIESLIVNNFTTPDKKNISSDELVKLTTFYTDKIKNIKQRIFDLQEKRTDINNKIIELNARLNQLAEAEIPIVQPKPTGQLILQVMSAAPGMVNFDFNYFTRNAGWTPTYDIRVKSIDNSFKIVYKALLTQTTGLNWNGIKLNLSTSNPNQGNTIPLLSPLYVQLYAPIIYNAVTTTGYAAASRVPMMQEDMISKDNESNFVMTKKALNNNNTFDVADHLTLKESQLNTNFEINLPYDIPSDGAAYSVNIKEEKILVNYQHIAIPKLDNDAFLIAQIDRWDSLSLLPGQANIIMDNVYLGKSYLDPNTTEDTLSLSLGRDKRIAIDRKLLKDYKSTKRGEFKTEVFTYEITIKNNKKQAVDMNVKDQYPISQTKEVEVLLTEDDQANINTETGILNWNINLKPGESKKIRFSYQLKYPKNKLIQELR